MALNLLTLVILSSIAGSSAASALRADSSAALVSKENGNWPMTSRVLSLSGSGFWEGSVRRRLADDVASTANGFLSPEAVSQLVGRLRVLRVRLGEVVSKANATMVLLPPGLEEENGAEENGEGLESVKVVDVVDDDATPLKLDWGRAVSKEQREQEDKAKQSQGRCPTDGQGGAEAGSAGGADVAAAHRLAGHADWRGGFAKGSMEWAPEKDRYILMDCHRGKSSTRVRCFRNYMLLAGLANRTLLVPMNTTEVASGYDRRIVFDLNHTRRCYGPLSVLSTQEFVDLSKQQGEGGGVKEGKVVIDQVLCLRAACYNQKGHGDPGTLVDLPDAALAENITWSTAPSTSITEQKFRLPEAAEIVREILPSAQVVVLGELEVFSFDRSLELEGDIPFFRRPGCPNSLAIHPHPAVLLSAERLIQSKMWTQIALNVTFSHTPANFTINNTGADGGSRGVGWQKDSEVAEIQDKRFVAVHWRRGEVGVGCKEPGVMCHVRAAQAAGCIARRMEKAGGIKTVFLVSDASPKELTEIRHALFQHIQDLRLVMLPPNLRGQKWAARLQSFDFQHQGLIVSTIDKCVAALADIFLGTAGSSFTLDIQRLRSGLRTATCEDAFVCEGQGHGSTHEAAA
ncbi:hypothetical protein CLOM_g6137 [Closterium sp. NIES-68]|nr:hypothetical protein CLOM_g6137 [Closterium sp. NIES-68]